MSQNCRDGKRNIDLFDCKELIDKISLNKRKGILNKTWESLLKPRN